MIWENICVVFSFLLAIADINYANLNNLKTFRCANGKYISGKSICNGNNTDCGERDRSDEFSACDKICGPGKFKCVGDRTCLNFTAYCNTIKDCADGSDEHRCGNEVRINDCHFHERKFLCYDKLKCLDLEYTCDDNCNCFDCSDEGENCTKTVPHGHLLVYSTPSRIKVLNLTTNHLNIIENLVEVATLTAAHDYIYFTKYQDDSRRLYKISISSKNTSEVLQWNEPITSVSIDYITNNIYFSTERAVLVCTREHKKSCEHILMSRDASNVALAPRSGMLFFTRRASQGDKKFIYKAGMDGTEEDIAVDGTFSDPVSLTVDESTETLYWLEKQENKIHSIRYTGGSDQLIKSVEHGGNNSTASITVLQNKVLFAKNQDNKITSLEGSQEFTPFYADVKTLSIEWLYAYNPLQNKIAKMMNPCSTNPCNESDDDLCVLRPSSSNSLNSTCLERYIPS
ncbi:low-density lipoprotein receptor-related protein 1-like [Planococcus citri]|uniref:low-density lipoprotein receptor-related protein 1-like n=1 Tax=Planococcus citri TaxID=170843 RepID=UPI0031FA338A